MSEPVPPIVVAPATVIAPESEVPTPQSAEPRTPKTTLAEDKIAAGQRHINLKWESTQQIIAIAVSLDVLLICTYIVLWGDVGSKNSAFIFVTNLAFLVVGTYFQRTNHTKQGGVGPKDEGR